MRQLMERAAMFQFGVYHTFLLETDLSPLIDTINRQTAIECHIRQVVSEMLKAQAAFKHLL